MKMNGKVVQLFALVSVLLLLLSATSFAQEERKIKMDEYKVQLADWQAREQAAQQKIDGLEADNSDLNNQIDDTQAEIDATWKEIYDLLGTDVAGVDAYRGELKSIGEGLDGLSALTPEDLFRRQDELDKLKARLSTAKESNLSYLTEMENEIATLDGKIAALEASMPANIFDQYNVMNGDNLWKIAKKPDIYDNPLQWIRIYNVNKDMIKDPNLIFPDQIFNIARGVAKNEYLVGKGDFLFKIAGMAKVFNDPTKWTKLYDANKDIIADPSMIYPFQVLSIPKE